MSSQQRSGVRARLTGLAALLTLLVLLVGIPAALLTVAGNPLTNSGVSHWQDLLRPDDGRLFLTVLVVVGWLAWATFALSVLLEAAAGLRGRPAPRLPALHLQQRAAAGLIGTAAVLFSLGGPAMAASAPPTVLAAVTQPATTTGPGSLTAPATTPASPDNATQSTTTADPAPQLATHTVAAGESLWSIAEQQLGDGARYTEIARLNYGLPQPDGAALTGSHWIRPGWTLHLPATANTTPRANTAPAPAPAEHLRTVHDHDTLSEIAQDEYGDPAAYPRIAQASRDIVQPGGAHLTDPDQIGAGWTVRIPGTPATPTPAGPQAGPTVPAAPHAPAAPAPAPAGPKAGPTIPAAPHPPAAPAPAPAVGPRTFAPRPAAPRSSAPNPATAPTLAPADHSDDQGVPVRTVAGVGALLAAGVLTLLATRRSAQQRRRRPGRTLPLPDGSAGAFERDLRAHADPLSVETVDLALRTLAAGCTTAQQPLPAVRAARLTAGQFDLYLAEPASLPEPWTGTADATVWTLPAGTDLPLTPEQTAQIPAPYPSLVTIGHDDEDGHVLLDLEHLGALAVHGDPAGTRQVLAALAVELATSRWADDLQVTLVGAYPELEDCLRTGRIRYLPAVGHLLDELAQRATRDRDLLTQDGADDLHHARAAGTAPDAWTPQILLLAGQLTDQQTQQLQDLVLQLPRVAVAAVTTGVSLGEWAIDLQGDDAVLDPIGLQIRPQRITDSDYAQLLETIAVADTDDETVVDEPTVEPTLAQLPATSTTAAVEHTPPTMSAQQPDATPAPAAATPDVAQPPRASGSVRIHVVPAGPAASAGPAQLIDLTSTPPQQTQQPDTAPVTDLPAAGSTPALDDAPVSTPQPAAELGEEPVELTPTAGSVVIDLPTTTTGTNPAAPATTPTEHDPVVATPEPTDVDGPLEQVDARPGPRVLILGPPAIDGARGVLPQDSHAPRLIEIAAYLTLHPGARTEMIRDEVFGNARTRPTNSTVHQAVSRLRRWLGDPREYLPPAKAGQLAFGPAVTSDWADWQQLLPHSAQAATTQALQRALDLVQRKPLAGSTYPWADHDAQLLTARIVDAAYELARRQLMEGRYQAVLATTAKGLLVEPSMERLWRLKILAAHATGNTDVEEDAISRVLQLAELLGSDLEPETTQLLTDLRDPTASRIDQLAAQAL